MAKIDKSKYDSTADKPTVESIAAINARNAKPWLNPLRSVYGADIADKMILAAKENDLVKAFKLGELASTDMVPANRMQERFDRFLAGCSDMETAIAQFEMGKALGADAETVYYQYFPQIGQAANDNEAPAPASIPAPKMHPAPFTSKAAGGLLGEISDWITSTAIIPVSELSLAASIALLGGMFGDLALGPTRSGVNLFITTVMGVASGKGHAPKSIMNLAKLAAKPGAVTNGDPTSYAAIERMLRKNKSTSIVMDEFGITLQDVNSRQKNAASASIRKFLLAIYDQADSIFHGRQYASADTKKDDSPIEGPALTVLGMTTGHALYNGLSEDSLNEGFISRFVFVEGNHPETISAPGLSRVQSTPRALIDSLKKATTEFPRSKGNLAAILKHIVPFAGGEDGDAYKRYAEVFLWQHWKGWSPRQHNVNGRAAENTVRLATIRAISRDPVQPSIIAEDVEWGWAIVHRSIEIITEGVDRYMSGSIPEALRKAVVEALRNAKGKTLYWSHLLQRDGVKQAETKDVVQAITWLTQTGNVEIASGPKITGPGCKFRLIEPAE
jgi:hypothetical protein